MYPSSNNGVKNSPMRGHQPSRLGSDFRSPAIIPKKFANTSGLPVLDVRSQRVARRQRLVTAPNPAQLKKGAPSYIQMQPIDGVEQYDHIDAYVTPGQRPVNRVLNAEFASGGRPTPLMPGMFYTGSPLAAGDSIAEVDSVLMCIASFLKAHKGNAWYKRMPLYANLFDMLQDEYDAIQCIEFLNIYELYEYSNVIISKMVTLAKACPEQKIPQLFLDFGIGLMHFTFDQLRYNARKEICAEWGYWLFFKLAEVKKQPNDDLIRHAQSPDVDFMPIFRLQEYKPELRMLYFIKMFYDVVPTLNNKEQVIKDWSRLPVYGRIGDASVWDQFPIEQYQNSTKSDIVMVTRYLSRFVEPSLTEKLACILTQTMLVNCFATFRSFFERTNQGRYTLTNDEVGNFIFFEVNSTRKVIKVIMTTFISSFTDLGISGKGIDKHSFTPAIPWVLSFELHVRDDAFEFKKPFCSMPVDFAFTGGRVMQEAVFKTMKDAIPF